MEDYDEYTQEMDLLVRLLNEAIHTIIIDDFERGRLISRLGCEYCGKHIFDFILKLIEYERHLGKKEYVIGLNKIKAFTEHDLNNINSLTLLNKTKMKD